MAVEVVQESHGSCSHNCNYGPVQSHQESNFEMVEFFNTPTMYVAHNDEAPGKGYVFKWHKSIIFGFPNF